MGCMWDLCLFRLCSPQDTQAASSLHSPVPMLRVDSCVMHTRPGFKRLGDTRKYVIGK